MRMNITMPEDDDKIECDDEGSHETLSIISFVDSARKSKSSKELEFNSNNRT